MYQGRRRVLKSGTAKTRSSADGTRGGEHERGFSPSRKWGSGDLPRENFDLLVLLNAFCMRLCFRILPVFVDKKNDQYSNII